MVLFNAVGIKKYGTVMGNGMKKNTIIFVSILVTSVVYMSLALAQQAKPLAEEWLSAAKPAPNPPGPIYSESETKSVQQTMTAEYDIKSKQEYVEPYRPKKSFLLPDLPQRGTIPVEESKDDWNINPDSSIKAATPPTQYTNTTTFPFNTIYKLVMRFNVGGTDYYYVCSGWSVGDFHIATAGHCIYNWDPNDDGDNSDKKWADEVWVYPGQTDLVLPNQCFGYCADRPYGGAHSVYLRSYTGWTNSQNHDHDWGVVTLDRNMGQRTGWMGRDSVLAASLNFSGYPSETPYVPSGVNVQYYGYDQNNVDNAGTTAFRIKLDAYIYGGHSGGPSWKIQSNNRYVVGIHSTSNRTGIAHDTLLTTGKRDDITTWMATDLTTRPPTNKPDLYEELFDGQAHKSINKTRVGKNEDLSIDYRILNAGFANATGNISVDFYASTNTTISENDTLLGSATVNGINGIFTYSNNQSTVIIPSSLAAGDYTVGYLLATNGEYSNDRQCTNQDCSNSVSIANQTLTVEDCTADGYENDNSTTNSVPLASSSMSHSICSSIDVDWYKIVVANNPSAVTIETSGPTGDTQMNLYATNGTSLIEFDDDDGINLMSKIDRECGIDELGPATYYVKINSYNNSIINNYNISVTTVDCVTDLIFKNGF